MKQPILDLDVKVNQLCENITKAFNDEWKRAKIDNVKFVAKDGSKYIKIIRTENGKDNCVWGFINKGNDKFRYGDILKASSWRKPALNHARGNIIDADYEIRGMRLYGPDYLR